MLKQVQHDTFETASVVLDNMKKNKNFQVISSVSQWVEKNETSEVLPLNQFNIT